MSHIAFARHSCSIEDFIGADPQAAGVFRDANGLAPGALLLPSMAYSLSSEPHARAVTERLSALSAREREKLSRCIDECGDLTVALADFHDRHLKDFDLTQQTGALLGAGAAAYGSYHSEFSRGLRRYQNALIALNEFEREGSGTGAQRAGLQARVAQSHAILNENFRAELRRMIPAADLGKNRGGALTSAQRGITLASRPRARGIYVSDQPRAVRMASFAQHLHHVGNGVIVLDAGIRVTKVRQAHRDGEDWMRQASIEATGFGGAGIASLTLGKATVSSLVALGLAATPAGWVIVIGLGIGVGVAVGSAGDWFGRNLAKEIMAR